MSFLKRDPKKVLIGDVHKRKRVLLGSVRRLFLVEKKISRLVSVESHLLQSAEKLDPSQKAAIDKVLEGENVEEKIVAHLSKLESQVQSLIKSGDVDAIEKKLKQYLYAINQLSIQLNNLELEEKAQIARIVGEEERLEREAEREAFGQTVKQKEEKKKALELLKASLQVRNKRIKLQGKGFIVKFLSLEKIQLSCYLF